LYALVGVGFVIVYRGTQVLNFAQGLLALIGGYFFYSIAISEGIPFWPALVLSLIASALLGALIYVLMLRPLMGQSALLLVMLTIALNIVLGAVALMLWGGATHFVKAPGAKVDLHLPGQIRITALDVAVVVLVAILLTAFAIMLRWSSFGSRMRAAAENPLLATYRGINVGTVSTATWAIATVGASMAGIIYGATNGLAPSAGNALGFAAFPAVVLGGLDSVGGALIGAGILAEVQGFAVSYLGGKYADVVGYGVLLLVLIVYPTGLFGSKEIARL
jgi:branched-chain amino acid transport system permease protein